MGTLTQAPTAVNGSAGSTVPLIAKTFARYVEIQEDGPTATKQGLTVTWPNGNVDNYPPADQPICLGSKGGALGGGNQALVGRPADATGPAPIAATVYCNVKSLTATATSVRVTEFN